MLFSAQAAAQEAKKKKGPPVYCTTQYDPVCARTVKGVLATFTNDCTAGEAGAAVIARGACEKAVKCPPAELTVCARKDGKNRNYTNACIAEKDGAAVLLRDKCPERCTEAGGTVCRTAGTYRGVSARLGSAAGRVKKNVEPLPTALVKSILPPMSSMRLLQIDRPSPVPWKRRACPESSCENG